MAGYCPKCGRSNCLDWDPNIQKYKCVWVDCGYVVDFGVQYTRIFELLKDSLLYTKAFSTLVNFTVNYVDLSDLIKEIDNTVKKIDNLKK